MRTAGWETVETRLGTCRACDGFSVPIDPPGGDASWQLVSSVGCSDGVVRLFWRRPLVPVLSADPFDGRPTPTAAP